MEEYDPSVVGDDEMRDASADGPPDPAKMPMDLSEFASWLMPPPEELIQSHANQNVFCPIFVPPKHAESLRSEEFTFCGVKIYLVEPELGISEDGQSTFSPELVKSGRRTELLAMDQLHVGDPISEETARALVHELGVKIINSRWVLTTKTIEGEQNQCRARCVVQEVASGSMSAHNLGISSATPSVEAFRSFISAVQYYDLYLTSLDISTAFLRSYLPKGIRAIIRLPADLSLRADAYQAVYCLDLHRAMNGLRVASKAWLGTCSQILRDNAGLITCPSEQTILAGVTNPSGVPTAALVYVDDLLVGALSPRGIDDVRSALSASLKVKTTGSITSSRGVGGKLMFLGREVIGPQHSSSMLVRVPPSYLEDLFTNEPFCSDLKASPVPPDLLAILEKGHRDPTTVTVLSEEAASRYKKIVGKLAWWCQSRPDHSRFLSLLATGQSDPTNIHENMLRKYLRFVRSVAHQFQRFPAESDTVPFYEGLTGVSDASWGSSDSEKRRSISGGVIYWKGNVIKAYSRMQHCITLSSCESEVIAVCQISQECIGLRHLTEFWGTSLIRPNLKNFTRLTSPRLSSTV